LVNIKVKFLAQAQRQCFAREDEICGKSLEGIPKEYGSKAFIPLSLIDNDDYWCYVARK
jgi:hypothetical protein